MKELMKKEFLPVLMIMLLMSTSCLFKPGYVQTGSDLDRANLINSEPGQGSTPTGGDLQGGNAIAVAKVEIRHLVEPKIDDNHDGGAYLRKLTLPKNYDGYLYVAGLNISTLADRNVSVRFKFGQNRSPITIPATVSTAPGIIPQTNIDVLVLDLRHKPFQNVQLVYDLFDYNDYDFSGADPSKLTEPVEFNRNNKLFCRGLELEDDPTFGGNLNTGCNGATDECKYAYAKVLDKGLIKLGALNIPIIPSEAQIENNGNGYYNDPNELKLKRCLPDSPLLGNYIYHKHDSNPLLDTILSLNDTFVVGSETYRFEGPYRPEQVAQWRISGAAIWGPNGIFQGSLTTTNSAGINYGIQSRLFPIYTTFNLSNGVEYFSSDIATNANDVDNMSGNGITDYMDGCNARATSRHSVTGEHIGSCHVSALIEIVVTNADETDRLLM